MRVILSKLTQKQAPCYSIGLIPREMSLGLQLVSLSALLSSEYICCSHLGKGVWPRLAIPHPQLLLATTTPSNSGESF